MNFYFDIEAHLKAAATWLSKSGIQSSESSQRYKGGVHGWYSRKEKGYPFIYSEITGYAITSYLELYKYFRDESFLTCGRDAADWIHSQGFKLPDGLLTRRYYVPNGDRFSEDCGLFCTFDAAIVLFGLVKMYRVLRSQDDLDLAIDLGRYLLSAQKPDGGLHALWNKNLGCWQDIPMSWSTQSGSFHAKAAMGLYALSRATGQKEFAYAAISLADFALQWQQEDGRFITNPSERATHLHPHIYSAEGLLYLGLKLGAKRYIAAASNALSWALSYIQNDRKLPSMVFADNRHNNCERSDILAQVVRMGRIFQHLEELTPPESQLIDNLFERLLSYQIMETDYPAEYGGFVYGHHEDGTPIDDVNCWCSQFAGQALLWTLYYKSREVMEVDYLV